MSGAVKEALLTLAAGHAALGLVVLYAKACERRKRLRRFDAERLSADRSNWTWS